MYLLDTHALLWFLFNDEQLSERARNIIINNKGRVFASIISLWESAIKIRINKLNFKYNPNDIMILSRKESITILNISVVQINETINLPLIHRDPFDRLLIAQAKVEDMTLVTCDRYIPQYPIRTVW